MHKVERISTPDLVALSHDSTASLTERERQIAMMASAGMTSQIIASTLSVSVRTIDNHLLRVYKKLGLNGRRELSQALRS
jgi:DNA-binding CsgD family transcriptional regulator